MDKEIEMKDGIYEIPKDLCIVCGCTYKTNRADHVRKNRAECKRMLQDERMKNMANTYDRTKEIAERGVQPEWHICEEICPHCSRHTQEKSEVGDEGHIEITAERCLLCGWIVKFDEL